MGPQPFLCVLQMKKGCLIKCSRAKKADWYASGIVASVCVDLCMIAMSCVYGWVQNSQGFSSPKTSRLPSGQICCVQANFTVLCGCFQNKRRKFLKSLIDLYVEHHSVRCISHSVVKEMNRTCF